MDKLTQSRIEVIRNQGYTIDFGNIFNHAFENYKKIAMYAGLIIFVFFVIISIAAAGSLVAIIGGPAIIDFFKPENFKAENLGLTTLLTISGVTIVVGSLLSPINAGLIHMAYCADKDEEFHVSTMFKFFTVPYFKELFLATFLVSLVNGVLSTAINYFQIPVLGFVLTIAFSLFTIMMIPLIIFGKLEAIEAIETSIMIVSKQPLVLLGLFVVGSIASMVGFIGCCIGVLFTIPFMYSLYYAIYSEIIGISSANEFKEKF